MAAKSPSPNNTDANTDYVVGLDIGGTNMVCAVVDRRDAHLLSRLSIPTDSARGPDDGLRRIGELIEHVVGAAGLTVSQVAGIGIGCTGPVDSQAGIVKNPFTLPGWDDLPLVDYLVDRFGLPAILVGDCDVAALGEHWAGAGQGSRTMLYLTFGTGIGGALISEGRLYQGLAMSEPGHMVIDLNGPPCYCGARGCFEMLAAAPAISRFAAERATPDGLMLKLANGQRDLITPETVSRAAQQGDPVAAALMEQTAVYIGVGLANLMNILSPEMIVLGGGIMRSWPAFEPTVRRIMNERNKMAPYDSIMIQQARLQLDAGVTGAARAMLNHLTAQAE